MFDHFSDIPQRLNFAVLQNLYRFEFDYEWLFLFIGTALLKHWDGGFLKIGTEA